MAVSFEVDDSFDRKRMEEFPRFFVTKAKA
jgi:hypothetical protein